MSVPKYGKRDVELGPFFSVGLVLVVYGLFRRRLLLIATGLASIWFDQRSALGRSVKKQVREKYMKAQVVQDDRGETTRAKTDEFAHEMYYASSDFTIAQRVSEVAARRGLKPTQVALAWLLARPGVTAPIVGTSTMAQLDELVGAVDVRLDPEETAYLESPYEPHRVLGHS